MTYCRFGKKDGGVIGEVSTVVAGAAAHHSLGYRIKRSLSRVFFRAW
jgi:hypothetical protein